MCICLLEVIPCGDPAVCRIIDARAVLSIHMVTTVWRSGHDGRVRTASESGCCCTIVGIYIRYLVDYHRHCHYLVWKSFSLDYRVPEE